MGDTMYLDAEPREHFTKQEQNSLSFWDRTAHRFYNKLNTTIFIGTMAVSAVAGGYIGHVSSPDYDPTAAKRDIDYVDAMAQSGAIFVPTDKLDIVTLSDGRDIAIVSAATDRMDATDVQAALLAAARANHDDATALNRTFGALTGAGVSALAMTMLGFFGMRATHTLRRRFPFDQDHFTCA